MAKGQKIGSLFYDIDGDESKLLKKLEKAKNEAVKIEEIFKNVKMDFGGSKLSLDVQKAQIAADKLAVSRDKATKAAMEAVRAEEMAEKAIAESNNVKRQGLVIDQKRATEAAKTAVEMRRASDIELNTLIKQEQAKRKALYDEERLAGLRKRNALIGVQGQKDLAAAYGLTNKTMFSQHNLLQQLSSAAGIYFSIYQAGAFVKELAMVSGEFEKQRLSLRAIIQDSEAADKIFNQIKDLAVYSPFNFKELTDYAKQLSAFSIPTNEIFTTMKNLADISAGLGVEMNRIILAYGQVRSASVLRGQELRQFTEAGIPLVDELAKKFHQLSGEVVTAGDVFEKISNREVPFAMIKEIFEDMTSAGGKFYNMQEIQATSLAGKISNLRDAYDIMLDSIGSANSEMLKGGVQGLVDIMDNWKKYWKILKSIIVTYGTYRAVLIAASVAQKGMLLTEQITRFIHLSKVITGATTANVAFGMSFKTLSAAMATNPIGIIAVAISSLIGLMTILTKETKTAGEVIYDMERSMTDFNKVMDNKVNNTGKLLKTYEELSSKVNKTESEHEKLKKVIAEITKIVPDAVSEFDKYGQALGINADAVKKYTEQQSEIASSGLKAQIEDGRKKIAELKKQQETINDVLKNGKIISTARGTALSTTEQRVLLGDEERNEILKKRFDILGQILGLENKQLELEKLLLGITEDQNGEKEQLSYFAQQINKEIDKLNFGDDLKDKIKVDDVTKDFKTIKESAVEALEELQKQVNQMALAPSLFKPADVESAKEMLSLYTSFVGILGGVEKKGGNNNKDSFTEKLKDQVELVKQAKSEYDKLVKHMSKSDAEKTITSQKAYSGVSVADLSDDGYLDFLNRQLAVIVNRNTDAAKSVRKSWEVEIASILFGNISKAAKTETEKIEKELSKYKDKYSLYETLFGITGDKALSIKLSFGNIEGDFKSYADVLRDQMKLLPDTSDEYKKLNDELEKLENSKYTEAVKSGLQAFQDFSTVEQKIEAVKNKYKELREAAADPITGEVNQVVIDGLTMKEKDEIDKLREELFSLTDYYKAIFGDLSEITFSGLKDMVSKGKSIVDSAKSSFDKDGKLKGYKVSLDGKDYEVTIQLFERFRKKILGINEDVKKQDPFSALSASIEQLKSGEISLEEFAKAASIAFSNIMDIGNEVGQSISNMLSSLGNEGAADALSFAFELGNAFTQMGVDLASGNPVQQVTGVVKGIANVTSSIANFHDKKLDKAIKKSQLEVKRLQNAYKELERIISRQLGSVTEKQASEMVKIQEQQIKELEKQIAAEKKKKKSDKGTILDMEGELAEAKDQLKYFYEDLANKQYGIDVKGWAGQIANALVNAFASGEDAAKAFDNTVADIMRSVIKNMVQLSVIEPAMEALRTKLFGDGGLLAKGTTNLSKSDGAAIIDSLMSFKGKIKESQDIWDYLNKAAKEAGISLTDQAEKDTLSKGIQSVTEDTANLLASYLNAIRGDVSAQKIFFSTLVQLGQANSSTFANMYAELVRIQVNTLRTADNTTKNVELVSEIKNMLKNVTTRNSGYSINV